MEPGRHGRGLPLPRRDAGRGDAGTPRDRTPARVGPDRPGHGHRRHGRRGHQHADPRPRRVLRPGHASSGPTRSRSRTRSRCHRDVPSAESPSRSLREAPDPDGSLLLVGGNGARDRPAPSPQARVDDLVDWTRRNFPGAELTHSWSAQDYVTSHGLPYVGALVPGRDHVLVAGGYAKWGMTNGVAAGAGADQPAPRRQRGVGEGAGQLVGGLAAGSPRHGEAQRGGRVGDDARLAAAARPARAGRTRRGGEVRLDHLGLPTAVSTVGGTVRRVSAVCPHLGGILRWNDAEATAGTAPARLAVRPRRCRARGPGDLRAVPPS